MLPGAVTSGVTVESGGTVLSAGVVLIEPGALPVALGALVTAGSVGNSATEDVLPGGIASGATVASGGTLAVFSGGIADTVTVQGGGVLSNSAGLIYGATILHEGFANIGAGAVVQGLTLSGGVELVAGGIDLGATLESGSIQSMGGYASGVTVNAGAEQEILGGRGASGTTVNSLGLLQVSGGSAFGAVVNSGAKMSVFENGLAESTEVNAGGTLALLGEILSDEILYGVASNTNVGSGGSEVVSAGGLSRFGTVWSGGFEVVNGQGSAVSDAIESGASAVISFGGAASNVLVAGLLTIESGGYASGTWLTQGGALDLAFLRYSGGASASIDAAGLLTVREGGSSATLALNSLDANKTVALSPDGTPSSGTLVTLAPGCFAAGTRLATPDGERTVETLAPGDAVLTAAGRVAPVRWVGRRRVDCRRHPRPHDVMPVLIVAGAFGPGLPRRNLCLSPDHAVFTGGALIPVRYLANGRTIAPLEISAIEYCHVELDRHDVLLAEGVAAESFLDTGNRGAFANNADAVVLHPDFARRIWDTEACAELVLSGPRLAAARRRLLARAAALGHRTTTHPRLSVDAGGRRLAAGVAGARWHVPLRPGVDVVTLRSRAWVPAEMRPESDDTRRLGVAIADLTLDGRAVALDSPALAAGWHAPEPRWRWTDGAADIPVAGVRVLAFSLAVTGQYWREAATSGSGGYRGETGIAISL